jgi:DNA topoisomerase-1
MSLLIVESPAKCSKIQGFLGPGWRVIATMGHIRALEEDLGAIGLDRDFEPRFQFIKEKSKAISQIKEAAAKADTIYLASDDDREGEAISYSVAVLLKLNPATTPRAVFREITESAVKKAVAEPRRLDMNRVFAQQARAVLDMMVGFTISPLLWKYVGPALSAGRCQTPALRLLVDREAEIRGFTVSTAWKVRGSWAAAKGPAFEAIMTEELEDEESAKNYLENIHADATGRVTEAATRPTTESPPKPLITSTLQQETSATMGLQPKRTMQIAQRLYEAGHITYMRTDCATLSEEARQAAAFWVRTQFGDAYVAAAPAPATAAKSKSKSTQKEAKGQGTPAAAAPQEAHEAIRPTHFELRDLPASEDWNAVDRRVYTLIWNRAVQSVMTPARGEQRTVDFLATADPVEFVWRATWKRQLFPGWRRIGAAATNLDAEDGAAAETPEVATAEVAWEAAAALKPGDALTWKTLETWPQDSKPPGRYTEATLVRELERRGIGRPSTFASLVGTVLDKGYAEKRDTAPTQCIVRRFTLERPGQWPLTEVAESKKVGGEKQKMAATPLGMSVLEFCCREFDGLFAYDFTSGMEARLDRVADGTEPWKQICRDTWDSYSAKYEELKAGASTVDAGPARQRQFAGGVKAVQSKKGPLLLKEGATKADAAIFYGWPDGKSFRDITEAEVAAFVATKVGGGGTAALGTHEGKDIVKKSGPFGTYAECGGVRVPWTAEDTEESLQTKLAGKAQSMLHTIGGFEFRNGPYGVFMFKKDTTGKSRKFVSVPTGVDPKALTLEAATKIYQTGLQTKAKATAFGKKNAGAK